MVVAQPLSSVAYRIQNVDFSAFLELPVLDKDETINPRPLKTSMKQQWYFSPVVSLSNTYKIRNAATPSFWIGIDEDESMPIATVETSASQWVLAAGDDYFEIYLNDTTSNAKYMELQLNDLSLSEQSLLECQKWRIVLPPSIKAGQYRIRSLSGDAILSFQASDSKILVKEQTGNNLNQKWAVTLDGKGGCAIKTADNANYYLSYDSNESIVQGSVRAFYWNVSAIDGVIHTINLNDFSIGFADYEVVIGKQVDLLKNINAYSQLWFFEPWVTTT